MAITERLGTLRALYNLHYLNNMTFSQLVISTRFDAMATQRLFVKMDDINNVSCLDGTAVRRQSDFTPSTK